MTLYTPSDPPPAPPRPVFLRFVIVDDPQLTCRPNEEIWLPKIGPTAWLLGKLISNMVGAECSWQREDLARRLGLGPATARLDTALRRCVQYRIFTGPVEGTFGVKRDWGTPKHGVRR